LATILVAPLARQRLHEMMTDHQLPDDARDLMRERLAVLERFPQAGQQLSGSWRDFRRLVGPSRWMQIIHRYDAVADAVGVVPIEDVRSSTADRLP
jgi:hypothetical protein